MQVVFPREGALENQLRRFLHDNLPNSVVWKIADSQTGGKPDFEVAWNGYTSKFECKRIKGNMSIHKTWEDGRQLLECVAYEKATTRCWIIEWRRSGRHYLPTTTIYRPSALLGGREPGIAITDTLDAVNLWTNGVQRFSQLDNNVVLELIKQTHG